MAGGKGSRMKPLTNKIKALLNQITTMILHIINKAKERLYNFTISINYLGEQIKYLGNGDMG